MPNGGTSVTDWPMARDTKCALLNLAGLQIVRPTPERVGSLGNLP